MSTSRCVASLAAESGSYPARTSSSARQRSTRSASVSTMSSTAGISISLSTFSLRVWEAFGSPPSGVLTNYSKVQLRAAAFQHGLDIVVRVRILEIRAERSDLVGLAAVLGQCA